jgi:RNA polymerase sigma-70 factor, ECF subfamily
VIGHTLDEVVRCERPRVLAALVAFCRDVDLAEDAFQDACLRAIEHWPQTGLPANPGAWLHTVAKRRSLDLLRRVARSPVITLSDDALPEAKVESVAMDSDESEVPDERLRLIFICCHPALAPTAQVALALRHICGLTTQEIARAYLEPEATTAQRLVRAKTKIREAGIPYEVPSPEDLASRLDGVLTTLYLVFNEGYAGTSGDAWMRPDLAAEAIRLGRLVVELLPDQPEARGLLALMRLHHSRRDTRVAPNGELVLLDEQNRALWHRDEIKDAVADLQQTLKLQRPGPYQIQASIAALHAEALVAKDTDWRQIAALYGALLRHQPTAIVQLNAAVACAFAYGFDHGLAWIDRIIASGELKDYYLLPAARAELLRRAGRIHESLAAYDHALSLVRTPAERAHLERRRSEIMGSESVQATS